MVLKFLQQTYLYKLVDPKLQGDPETCKGGFKVEEAVGLGRVRRRDVYKGYVLPSMFVCEDQQPKMCARYFGKKKKKGTKGRKGRVFSCKRWSWTKRVCRRTCGYCS